MTKGKEKESPVCHFYLLLLLFCYCLWCFRLTASALVYGHVSVESRLWNVDGLADHQTAMEYKHGDDGMEFGSSTLEPEAERDFLEDPAVVHPVGHDLHHEQGHGNRGAFKVF